MFAISSSCHTAPWHAVNFSSWFIKDTKSMCLNFLMRAVILSVHNWPWLLIWNIQEEELSKCSFSICNYRNLSWPNISSTMFFGVDVPRNVFFYNMSSDMGEFCFAYRAFFPFLLKVEPFMRWSSISSSWSGSKWLSSRSHISKTIVFYIYGFF